MDIDFSQFSREDFKINGFRRAIVEDNDDPTNSGRVRVRIIGIHSLDGEETPVSHLPWAEQCLTLYNSGGFNLTNTNNETPVQRYESGGDAGPVTRDRPSKRETEFNVVPEWQDQTTHNNGTGGIFTVPSKGTMVWVFFDAGNHLKPQYFAAAPRKLDWDTQFEKLSAELQDKEQTLTDIIEEMDALASENQEFTGERQVTQNIQIKTPIIQPSFNFKAQDFNSNVKNKDLTSWTSPGGTTFLAINDRSNGSNEKVFIMHKGYLEHVDQSGQRTVLIGKTNQDSSDPLSPQHAEGEGNDFRNIVANNSELYVLGDHKIFVKQNCFIQCEKSVEINAKDEVGIFTREGNVNILAESADVNVESKSANFNVSANNTQMQVDQQLLVHAGDAIKIKSDTSIDFVAPLIQFEAEDQLTIKGGNMKGAFGETKFEITPDSFVIESSGEVSAKANDFIVETSNTIQTKTQSHNVKVENEYLTEVSNLFSLKSNQIAVEGATLSMNGTAETKINGATASYSAAGQCFVGGATTQVGGIVQLGQGQAAQTDRVSSPSVNPPTPPNDPDDVEPLEFQAGAEAKEIVVTETNFPEEDA